MLLVGFSVEAKGSPHGKINTPSLFQKGIQTRAYSSKENKGKGKRQVQDINEIPYNTKENNKGKRKLVFTLEDQYTKETLHQIIKKKESRHS